MGRAREDLIAQERQHGGWNAVIYRDAFTAIHRAMEVNIQNVVPEGYSHGLGTYINVYHTLVRLEDNIRRMDLCECYLVI